MLDGRGILDARRWSIGAALVGALAWLGAPWLPVGSAPAFVSIEHVFVSLPLVSAPLALALLALLASDGKRLPFFYRVAAWLQPVAAGMVLGSFFVPKGRLAGLLTLGWSLMAVLVAIGGVRLARRGAGANLSNVSLLAAHSFLPVGAVWLACSRLGVGPASFSALTVFLAALHFHFSGFTLQILMAATGRQLHASGSRMGGMHRCVAVGAIAGIPSIALGNALSLPALKFAGVASMVVSVVGLAATSLGVARTASSPLARALLRASAVSVVAGMVLAGVYGVGELTGRGWIGIPRMVEIHGLLNALGFVLCGSSAHLFLLPARQRRSEGALDGAHHPSSEGGAIVLGGEASEAAGGIVPS